LWSIVIELAAVTSTHRRNEPNLRCVRSETPTRFRELVKLRACQQVVERDTRRKTTDFSN
jgi:hypothetical protein